MIFVLVVLVKNIKIAAAEMRKADTGVIKMILQLDEAISILDVASKNLIEIRNSL